MPSRGKVLGEALVVFMLNGPRFHAPRTDAEIDTVLTVGLGGTATILVSGLLAEILRLQFFGIESAKLVLGLIAPIYLGWMLYRFYWYTAGRQTTLSEFTGCRK